MRFFDGLIDLALPPSCVACDEVLIDDGFFCEDCEPLTLDITAVHCLRCGEPGRFPPAGCPRCRAHTPSFDRAWAPFEHDGAVARAIHRFKYEDRADLARPLGRLLALRAARFLDAVRGAVLCPIPLHRARFCDRLYDQATLLTVAVGQFSGVTLDDSLLTRVRPTTRQVGLSDAEREHNVRGAFETAGTVRGARVVLVDDVLTTGATAREAARVLFTAGAKNVHVLTLARARRQSIR